MTSTLIYILHAYWNAIHFKQLFQSWEWCLMLCNSFLSNAFRFCLWNCKAFPENIYPLEFTKAHVTCIAFDANGIHVPEKIKFMRRDQFHRFEELKPNDNLRFTNKTEQEGKYCIYIGNCIVLRFVNTCFIQVWWPFIQGLFQDISRAFNNIHWVHFHRHDIILLSLQNNNSCKCK